MSNFMYNFDQDFTLEQLVYEPMTEVAWVHMSCASWLPEVTFGDDDSMEPIGGNNIYIIYGK